MCYLYLLSEFKSMFEKLLKKFMKKNLMNIPRLKIQQKLVTRFTCINISQVQVCQRKKTMTTVP